MPCTPSLLSWDLALRELRGRPIHLGSTYSRRALHLRRRHGISGKVRICAPTPKGGAYRIPEKKATDARKVKKLQN